LGNLFPLATAKQQATQPSASLLFLIHHPYYYGWCFPSSLWNDYTLERGLSWGNDITSFNYGHSSLNPLIGTITAARLAPAHCPWCTN